MKDGAAVVVVGTSLGGLSALTTLLSGLPRGFDAPIVIVQHRGKNSAEEIGRLLGASTALPVSEPDDKDPLERGRVYVGPADYHLLVEPGRLALSTDPPVNYARPSIDLLFESAAYAYGSAVVGVIMTGANQDGAQGCVHIRRRGGIVLAQDPAEAHSGVMPGAAIALDVVDEVLPLGAIPAALGRLSNGGRP